MTTGGYVTQAMVFRVVSVYGTYEVKLNKGKGMPVPALAVNETASALYGVHTPVRYLPGTWVIVFVPEHTEDGTYTCFILGACNDVPIITKKNEDGSETRSPYAELSYMYKDLVKFSNRNDTSLKKVPKDTFLENNYSYRDAADILPGEWAKTTCMGGGFFLNDFMVSMGMNERCRIEGFLFKDLLRITADQYQERVGAYDRSDFLEANILGNSVIRGSATVIENVGGLLGVTPFSDSTQTNDSPYSFENTAEHPYYNYQQVSGDLSQGILESYTVPPADITEPPPGVLSIYKGYDGTYRVQALKELSFEKTSLIPVPWAIDEPSAPISTDDFSDFKPEEYFDSSEIRETDASFYGAEAVRQINAHNLEKDSLNKFRVRDKIWIVPENKDKVLADINKSLSETFKDDPKLETLPIADPYYQEPPTVAFLGASVDDEGYRDTFSKKVYDLSSMIKQTADGSIIISGGYGEEIRMYRGNIYITCPGDIVKTPGRDHIMWAGGNNIQKANRGTTEIESKSTTLITDGNMQMVSGTGGEGTMLLESKATSDPDMDEYKEKMGKNTPVGGGIIFKGQAVATVSDNIYLQGEDENNVNSKIFIKANRIHTVVQKAMTFIQNGGDFLVNTGNSMIGLNSGRFAAAASLIGFNAESIKGRAGSIVVPYREFSDEAGTYDVVMGSGSPPDTELEGNLKARVINGLTIGSDKGGELAEIDYTPPTGEPPGKGFESASVLKSLEGLAKNKKLKQWGIVLPAERYSKFELPVSRWQNMISGKKWVPVEIEASFESTSKKIMAYPGKEQMEKVGSLKKLGDGGTIDKQSLSDNLIINSE